MAADLTTLHARSGINAFDAETGMRALNYCLQQDESNIQAADLTWNTLSKHLNKVPAWLKNIIHEKSSVAQGYLVTLLSQTEMNQRETILKAELIRILREMMGISSSQSIDDTQGFFEMGMDSLMSVELRNRIQAAIGEAFTVPTTFAFENANITKMAENLLPMLNLGQARAQITYLAQATTEPMAIIGMSCRFPQGANSIEAFWQKLKEGEDLVTEIPSSRWNVDEYYSAESAPDKMYTRMGAFLDVDVSLFDAAFFGISPKEAEVMDPQQRLLLEVVWEALEDSGIDPKSLNERQIGFFLGQMNHDYSILLEEAGEYNAYVGSGTAPSAAAGRVSYILGLQGPCMAIDTACSSSLVALNSAMQSIRDGESEMAIVAGVSLMLSPKPMIQMCQAKMLTPEGHCKTFDASADGYTRGEGCGVIVLKPLSKAKEHGDRIWGLVRASAVNQDGASSGLTVPNANAQERLIKYTLSKAGLNPEDIDYIEAHGTGTSLGDPIEVRGLTQVFSQRKNKAEKPLIISSTKTYLGHMESAAGIAGLIRTVLSMHYNYIPKHLHFNHQNPAVDFAPMNALIPIEGRQWPETNFPKRATVSSFGFSGIIASAVLEEAPKAYEPTINPLPVTQFNRQHYWIEVKPKHIAQLPGSHPLQHAVLTSFYQGPDNSQHFSGEISLQAQPYWNDHCVLGEAILPGAAYSEAFYSAMQVLLEKQGGHVVCAISNITFEQTLAISHQVIPIELKITQNTQGHYELSYFSFDNDKQTWHQHAQASGTNFRSQTSH